MTRHITQCSVLVQLFTFMQDSVHAVRQILHRESKKEDTPHSCPYLHQILARPTCLRFGGIFDGLFIANFRDNEAVKCAIFITFYWQKIKHTSYCKLRIKLQVYYFAICSLFIHFLLFTAIRGILYVLYLLYFLQVTYLLQVRSCSEYNCNEPIGL